jgi:hypothetical protein
MNTYIVSIFHLQWKSWGEKTILELKTGEIIEEKA